MKQTKNRACPNSDSSLIDSMMEYIHLHIIDVKLLIAEHIAKLWSSIIGIFLAISLFVAAMIFLGVAAVLHFGAIFGYTPVIVFVSLIFLLLSIVIFICRRYIFVSSALRYLITLLFPKSTTKER